MFRLSRSILESLNSVILSCDWKLPVGPQELLILPDFCYNDPFLLPQFQHGNAPLVNGYSPRYSQQPTGWFLRSIPQDDTPKVANGKICWASILRITRCKNWWRWWTSAYIVNLHIFIRGDFKDLGIFSPYLAYVCLKWVENHQPVFPVDFLRSILWNNQGLQQETLQKHLLKSSEFQLFHDRFHASIFSTWNHMKIPRGAKGSSMGALKMGKLENAPDLEHLDDRSCQGSLKRWFGGPEGFATVKVVGFLLFPVLGSQFFPQVSRGKFKTKSLSTIF